MPENKPTRTRLCSALAESLERFRDDPELRGFWAVFAAHGLEAPADIAVFEAACGDDAAIVDLMVCTLDAVKQLQAQLKPEHPARVLAPALMLAAAERYLAGRQGWREDTMPHVVVRLQDVLAAAMAAAVAHDAGLRVVRGELDDARCELANVVRAADISALGYTTVKDQAVAALLAARDAGMGLDHRQQRQAALARLRVQGLPEPEILRAELRALARVEKVKLMFMLQPQADGSVDEALIDFLQSECGVPAWVHRPAADAEASSLKAVQASLLRYIEGVHDVLQPGRTTRAPRAAEPPLIFVSYAHEDDQPMAPLPQSPARLLRNALEAHSGDGGAIQYFLDTEALRTGDDWHAKIQSALQRCTVAVLMLSNQFFASDYVRQSELPRLRERHRGGGLLVLPIQVRPCEVPQLDHAAWLEPLQRERGVALTGLHQHEAETAINNLVARVREHCANLPKP